MAVALDTGSPFTGTGTTGATVTATVSTTGTNRLLLCVAGTDGGPATAVSGGGLTWVALSTGNANANVWWAWAASTLTSQVITATNPGGQTQCGIIVVCLSGAQNRTPKLTQSSGASGACSVSATAAGSGSWMAFMGDIGTGNATAYQANNTAAGTLSFVTWKIVSCNYNTLTTKGSSYTMGLTTTGSWDGNALEVFDVAYSPGVPGTLSMMGCGY